MAILVPKTPQYTSKQRPGSLSIPYADLRGSRALGSAFVGLGSVIVDVADRMKQERDAAVVGDIYNEWRDADRDQLSQLLSLKGQEAANLGEKYDQWYNDGFSKANERSENGTQQKALQTLLDRKREQNLDILARYESQERKRYKAEVETGLVSQAEQDIRLAGFDNEAVNENISTLFEWMDAAYPGQDLTALKQKYKSQLLFANAQTRIDEDPDRADEFIEANKLDLGESYFALKDSAKKESKQNLIDNVQAELQVKYETGGLPDFDKMRKDLTHNKDIPFDVKFEVRQWLDAYEAQYTSKATSSQKQAHDEEERAIGMAFLEGNYADVRNMLRRSEYLTGDELKTWTTAINKAAKEAPVDPVMQAAEIVRINDMIIDKVPRDLVRREIIISPYLGNKKEKYLNKLDQELSSELESARSEAKKRIKGLLIPKRGPFVKMLETPLEVDAVATAQDALDEWIDIEIGKDRYPSRDAILKKARELALSNQVPIASQVQYRREEAERQAREIQKAAEK